MRERASVMRQRASLMRERASVMRERASVMRERASVMREGEAEREAVRCERVDERVRGLPFDVHRGVDVGGQAWGPMGDHRHGTEDVPPPAALGDRHAERCKELSGRGRGYAGGHR
jgi:hypothetical protein